MDQRAAFTETIVAIGNKVADDEPLFMHIKEMEPRLAPEFSNAKIGRWLGWAQGVACAKNWLTLDEVKNINKRYANGR